MGLLLFSLLVLALLLHPPLVLAETKAMPVPTEKAEPAADEEFEEEVITPDPIEPWNRLMFQFNDKLYFWVLKPAAKGYNAVVPRGARVSVRNFFHNITTPIRFVNSLLQGKPKAAVIEVTRFGVNSTLGIGGLFDVAHKEFNLKTQDEDLGLTLGHYGMGEVIYLVLPFFGPSTLRDAFGRVGDAFLDPVNYVTPIRDSVAIRAYDTLNETSLQLGDYEDLKEAAIDPYLAIKDAYIQYRKARINRGDAVVPAPPAGPTGSVEQ
ncbi:MAG: VacJ family lipoprotein [Nitrospirales bacterium]|nr:VacJ family lipoprotein [Nitrospirales bacterium]